MVILETSLFTSQITALVNDDDYATFQIELIRDPAAGDLIPRRTPRTRERICLRAR